MSENNLIRPNWPAPPQIEAYTGKKELVEQYISFPSEPIWLRQVHGNEVVEATLENREKEADALYTKKTNHVCVVDTADCVPILICHPKATLVAAIHAGWRGLAKGVIETTLSALNVDNKELLAWIGPCISQKHYEVGDEVKAAFLAHNPDAEKAFIPSSNGRWLADLSEMARINLKKQGVTEIFGGEYCTYSDPERFYSYRRDGSSQKRRIGTFIWIKDRINK